MWESPDGPRQVKGRERALFVEAVLTLYDVLRDGAEGGEAPEMDVPVFDRIPAEDRSSVLLWVAERVLTDDPAPPVRSWSAGTVAAIFAHLEAMTELEIEGQNLEEDDPPRTTWRKLVHEAWMEICFPQIDSRFPKGRGNKQPLDSRDQDEWSFKIDGLAGELLGDEDYAMEEILDIPPDRAAAAKEYLGIEGDYYTEAHPAFSPPERERLAAFHRTLLAEASP